MAINFVGVKRRLRRRKLVRRKRYFGPNGWGWVEVNASNSFTDIDNNRNSADFMVEGSDFKGDVTGIDFGGANNKQLVVRRLIVQLFGSVQLGDPELYPFIAWDIALVKTQGTGVLGGGAAPGLTLDSIQTDSRHRVLMHRRVWFGSVPGQLTPAEGEQMYGTVASDNRVDFDIRPNVPLGENETIQLFVGQSPSELYLDGDTVLVQGFCKYFAQQK